jgi:hypothetical protein
VVDLPCNQPPTTIVQPFKLDPDGCVRAQLPGSGTAMNDRLGATLDLTVDGTTHFIYVPLTTPIAKLAWNTAVNFLIFPLSIPLGSANCSITYAPLTREIVICPLGGSTIDAVGDLSGVTIDMDPSKHTVFTSGKGDRSNFVYTLLNPLDTAYPEPLYEQFIFDSIGAFFGLHPAMQYDEFVCDEWLYDSLPHGLTEGVGYGNFGEKIANGEIRSAVLEIHMTGHDCETETDSIAFWHGDSDPTPPWWEWGSSMIELADLSYQWLPGDEATLCFDLSALPNSDGSLTSLLANLSLRDRIDWFVGDDTAVSYVELKVLRANP